VAIRAWCCSTNRLEGIQPSIIDEIVETLQRLRAKSGLTMILVEQNLDFIAALSQRILIIQKGTITREVGPRRTRRRQPGRRIWSVSQRNARLSGP